MSLICIYLCLKAFLFLFSLGDLWLKCVIVWLRAPCDCISLLSLNPKLLPWSFRKVLLNISGFWFTRGKLKVKPPSPIVGALGSNWVAVISIYFGNKDCIVLFSSGLYLTSWFMFPVWWNVMLVEKNLSPLESTFPRLFLLKVLFWMCLTMLGFAISYLISARRAEGCTRCLNLPRVLFIYFFSATEFELFLLDSNGLFSMVIWLSLETIFYFDWLFAISNWLYVLVRLPLWTPDSMG